MIFTRVTDGQVAQPVHYPWLNLSYLHNINFMKITDGLQIKVKLIYSLLIAASLSFNPPMGFRFIGPYLPDDNPR
jgi:hypothetical protein